MRLIYAGTPDFAVPPLKAIQASDHRILLVLTQPDRPAGRGRRLRPPPVKVAARDAGLKVLQLESLKDPATREALARLEPDLMVVTAYGLLLPQKVLDLPRHGCWNLHASLLPRWRGAAPIQRAIWAGDECTGISLMRMTRGLDAGPVIDRRTVPIHADDTAGSLHERLSQVAADLIVPWLDRLERDGRTPSEAQDEALVTYAPKLSKAEAELDFRRPAAELERQVRALNPWPVAWARVAGERLRIWRAQAEAGAGSAGHGTLVADAGEPRVACGDGWLRLLEVQPEGRRPMRGSDFVNARPQLR